MFPDARPMPVMHISTTTTFRLTAALGLVFLCALSALLGWIYVLTQSELTERTDRVLWHEARSFARMPAGQWPDRIGAMLAANASHFSYYALIENGGPKNRRLLAGNFMPPPGLVVGRVVALAPGRGAMPPLRVLAVRAGGQGVLLVIGRDISQIEDLRHRLITILAMSGLVAAWGVMLGAVALSIAPLRRIRRLTALSARIGAGELMVRMPVSSRGDELDVIAGTINAMVAEIARLLEQVKNATDAIAHDLRAPLARARSRLEVIRRQDAGRANMLDGGMLDDVAQELDLVLARFTALLRIAELESANRRAGFGLLDPMVLIHEVCELYEPLAEAQGVRLYCCGTEGYRIRGDTQLLFEMLSNLVDNAIKFIATGDEIIMSAHADGGMMALSVRDNGPGIPPEERADAVRRFYRGTATRHLPGSGLGLSLVAAIVHLHGFTLDLVAAAPGLDVRICGPIEHFERPQEHRDDDSGSWQGLD